MADEAAQRFIEVDRAFLASIATDSDRIPTLYYSRYWPVRRFFWMRLRLAHRLIRGFAQQRRRCLDFGGGGGVFLPTLAGEFDAVTCIDLEDAEARAVVDRYRLANVDLYRSDISAASLDAESFDVIVAADVLEHFADLAPAISAINRWLAPDGVLVTSLPSETGLYAGLRKVFGVAKPADHYHAGAEVERELAANGFSPLARRYVPMRYRVLPLFLVTAWAKTPA